MILSIAWRNIWRNKLRSSVIVASVSLGIFAGVFTWAFYRGMVVQRVQAAIMSESSSIQIHNPEYTINPDQKFFMEDVEELINNIASMNNINAVSKRLIVDAMINSAETGAGVRVMGIDPEKEMRVTNIYRKIIEGTYFGGSGKSPVVIGSKLAEKLSVGLRSRLVLTLQDINGNIITGLFRVEGIYRSGNSVYDELNIFINRDELAEIAGFDETTAHEIAVLLNDNDRLEESGNIIKEKYPGFDIKTWKELMPEVSLVESAMDLSMYIFLGVILLAMVFGIVNTMLMAVLERTKELGMLMAIGMNKMRLFYMIVSETVLLVLTGGIAGLAIAYPVSGILGRRGIDLSTWSDAFEKLGYESVVYPVAGFDIALSITIMILLTGFIASLYPAFKALQYKPAEALHLDL